MRFICVRIEIGLYEVVSFLLLFPPLKIGVTLAIFRLSGYTPSKIHLLKILVRIGTIIELAHFRTFGGISSIPTDLPSSNS